MHPSVRTNVCHFLRKSACNLQRSSQPISSQSHKACFINASHGYKTQVIFSYVLTFAMPLLLWVSSVKYLFSILAPLQSRRVLTHIETSSNKNVILVYSFFLHCFDMFFFPVSANVWKSSNFSSNWSPFFFSTIACYLIQGCTFSWLGWNLSPLLLL